MSSFFRREIRAGFFRRYLVLALLVPLGYLTHVCLMPYLKIGGVTPNLLYCVIAIVTVAYGRLQAFWVGLIYGLVMEVMLPAITFLNLAIYPLSALFTSFVFADKSLRRLEMDRALKRKSRELPPFVRTILCAMMNVLIYEIVNIAYIYLGGTALTIRHFIRGFLDVLLTGVITVPVAALSRRLIFGRRVETPVLRNQPIVFGKK